MHDKPARFEQGCGLKQIFKHLKNCRQSLKEEQYFSRSNSVAHQTDHVEEVASKRRIYPTRERYVDSKLSDTVSKHTCKHHIHGLYFRSRRTLYKTYQLAAVNIQKRFVMVVAIASHGCAVRRKNLRKEWRRDKCTHSDEQNADLPCVVRALGPEKQKNEPGIRRSQYAQVLHSEKVTLTQAITAPRLV